MLVAPKRILTAVLICISILTSSFVFGQTEGNVLVNTDPQGSLVRLQGDMMLSGVTPVKFGRTLSGKYRIQVTREGYETYNSTAYFSNSQFSQLDIELVPKTRFKAFLRSFVIPGWGQRYYGDNTKAAIFALGAIASGIGYAFAWDDFDTKKETYERRKTALDAAEHWSDIPRLHDELLDAQREADDAEDVVNAIRVMAIGVYALNLLDTFLFFPEYTSFTEYKAITANPEFGTDRIGLTVSLTF
jgi:hypothetical protein